MGSSILSNSHFKENFKKNKIVRIVLIPIATVFLVTALKKAFPSIFGQSQFLLFYLPILISAGAGGLLGGIIATFLSSVVVLYFFSFPYQTFIASSADYIDTGVYFFEGLIISVIVEGLYGARENAEKTLVALRTSQERYKLLVENATDYAIFMIDVKGRIISWNSGAQKLLGYKKDEIIGKHFSILYSSEDRKRNRAKKELQEALQKGKASDDNWVVTKTQHQFWASGMTMPVRNGRKTVIGYEKIIRDATEAKQVQERRDDFISIATHEIRTPVTTMNAYFGVLEKRLHANKNFKELFLFEKVNEQLKKLTVLIKDLLDVSRVQNQQLPINKELLHIDEVLHETVSDIQQASKEHKIVLHDSPNAFVYADKSRISQVISNLLSNAIKYSPQEKNVIVSAEKESKNIKIAVTDFGSGLTKENQEKVFDRFYRATSHQNGSVGGGLGLGLFIAREIVHQHHGTIGVTSEIGKGSTFFFTLPLSQTTKKSYTRKKERK